MLRRHPERDDHKKAVEWYLETNKKIMQKQLMHTRFALQMDYQPENKLEHGCLSKIKVLLDDGLPARQVCIVTFCDTSVAMRASWR